MVAKCPADNSQSLEQENFWDGHWDAHKVGWLISGCAAAVTCGIALITILGHARNYTRPLEQRQIIRVLLFAPVFAVVSFLSYRFFRSYTYYELAEVVYEAFAIAAFLMLMLQYIGDNVDEQKQVFISKDKKPLPLPFCCLRYRPSKAYFLVLLKWSVVQYVIIRPALSVAGIVTEYYEVLCQSSLSYQYAYVYILGIDFVSISIALYGLIVLYALIRQDLKGRRPLAKFMTIKLGIFLIFYQGFVFSILADRGVIKATEYWTKTNISDGLNALCTSLEMVLIAALQMWAFHWGEYKMENLGRDRVQGKVNQNGKSSIFFSLVHAFNFSDYAVELWHEVRFLVDRIRGKAYTREDARFGKFDFVQAFDADDARDFGSRRSMRSIDSRMELREMENKVDESMAVARGQGGEGRFDGHYATGHQARANGDSVDDDATLGRDHAPMRSGIPERLSLGLTPGLSVDRGGRISPKPRSPRDSTGRYPTFLYETEGSPHSDAQYGRRNPGGAAGSGGAGGYRVAGFPLLQEEAASPPSPSLSTPTPPRQAPLYVQQQSQQQQQQQQQQQHLQPPLAHARQHPQQEMDMTDEASQVPLEPNEDRPRSWEPQAF